MPFILVLLVLVLVAPAVMLPVVLVLLVFLLPFLLIFQSFLNVVLIPWQMVQLAADKRMRQNHALEHATVNVIEQQYGPTTLTGLAALNPFSILFLLRHLIPLAFLFGLALAGHFTLWGVVAALVLAHVLARPVGALMQRAFTTDPDVGDLEVVDIGDANPQMGLNLFFPLGPQRYFIQTRTRQPVHWFLRWF